MKPLAEWLADATSLAELEFCTKHPYPLLLLSVSAYQLTPVVHAQGQTIDRAVLTAGAPMRSPTSIEEYVAVEIRAKHGVRTLDLTLGCSEDCDVVINDASVSKLHARMTRDRHGNWYVQDASSTTGTHVNDTDPAETQVLVSGDRLSLGHVDLIFLLPAQVFRLVKTLGSKRPG